MAELPTFKVSVLTQEKVHLDTDAVHLEAPGSVGYLGILANHAPLMTTLMPGKIIVSLPGGEDKTFAVSGGLLKVSDNKAVVLAEAVEMPEQIDIDRAMQAKERAERRLKEHTAETDLERAAAALDRALNRIRLHMQFFGARRIE
jgi:F-type H+-transporting ATPase subunit epsilon